MERTEASGLCETEYLDDLIKREQQVTIRLSEGRDISAVLTGHDPSAVIARNARTGRTSLIYKRSISVITPAGG
jgi:sRNA-binding regulator protein Hfq